MNRFNYRDELMRNAEAVGKLYLSVIASWTQKLIKEYRYKQVVPEETILQLEKMVRRKLTNFDKSSSNALFAAFLQKKESTRAECELQEGEVERVELATPKAKAHTNEQLNETAVKTEPSKSVADNQEEEYVDDLAEFETPQEHKQEVKIESTPSTEVRFKEEEREKSEESSENDYNQRIEEKIGSAILGTFCSFHIKRKPKEEKIFIDLENVFVKNSNNHFENFHTKIACELTKIEKEDIRQLRS